MLYINLTNRTIKVRGVTFTPGACHEVADSINIPGIAPVPQRKSKGLSVSIKSTKKSRKK